MNTRTKTYISIFVVAFLTHIYMFTNKFLNNDDVYYVVENSVQSNLGRWFLEIVSRTTSKYSIPLVNGLLSMLFIILASYFVCEIFDVQNELYRFIIGVILVTFPINASNNAYMFVAEGYGLAIMLAVVFSYILIKQKTWKHIPLAIISLTLSLAIYQSYLCMVVGIFWIWLLFDCIQNIFSENYQTSIFKKHLTITIEYYVFVVVSLIIYFISNKIAIKISGNVISNYQNLDNMGKLSINEIIIGSLKSYYRFLMFLFGNLYGETSFILVLLHIFLLVLCIVVVYQVLRKSSVRKINGVVLVVELSLLPLMIESIEVVAANAQARHIITRFASVLWYIIPVLLIAKYGKVSRDSIRKNMLFTLTALICVNYFFCNVAYYKLDLTTQNIKMMLNRVAMAIETTEGYIPGETPVWIDFTSDGNTSYINNEDDFACIRNMVGINNTHFIYYGDRVKAIMNNYLYFDYCEADEEEIENIKTCEQYKDMQAYPYPNSIEWIEGVLVVKLTE